MTVSYKLCIIVSHKGQGKRGIAMRKHIKSIGNYNIIAETINDDDIIYNVENYCKLIDWFTTQELAEQFIVEAIGL